MKISTARKITLTAAVLLVVVGLIWSTGTGALSSFGWEQIAAICPLGILEVFLASKTMIPRALIVLIITLVAVIILGKVFCAWLCPVPPLRNLFSRKQKKNNEESCELDSGDDKGMVDRGTYNLSTGDSDKVDKGNVDKLYVPLSTPLSTSEAESLKVGEGCGADSESALKPEACSSCVEQRKKLDSRHLVLGGALVSTAIFGFPVFCLVCPVGLTFATIIAFWRLVGFNEPTLSLLVFPAILIIEVLFLKKWCLKFCPLGAVMSLMSIPNKLFRPKVNQSKCLRIKGQNCTICADVCAEELDPHFQAGMHECTKCGICKDKCPAGAISIPFLPIPKKQPPQSSNSMGTTPNIKNTS
jgi:ferredoxin-type protein NapH